MSGYILQGKKADGSMVNIDLAAKYDALGEEISVKYATKSELADAGNFDENGSYPNLTAGNATHAVRATQDAAGNNIQSTYATKTDLNTKANQTALDGVINGTTPVAKATTADSATNAANATNAASADYATSAGSASTATNATHATSADSATKATQDEAGNNIQSTYATKSEVGGNKVYTHYISFFVKHGGDQVICMIEYQSKQSEPYTLSSFVDDLYNDGFWSDNTNNIRQKLFKASGQLLMNSKTYEIMGVGVYYQTAENRLAVFPRGVYDITYGKYTYIIEYDNVVDYVDYVV